MPPKIEKDQHLVVANLASSENEGGVQPPPLQVSGPDTEMPQSSGAITPSEPPVPPLDETLESRSFWKAGNYAVGPTCRPSAFEGSLEHARVHPKFLHSNATSHKWAFGAIAELMDNAVDEIQNGATFVKVDKVDVMKDHSPALLFQDDGGGMNPELLRKCMSLGYSSKKSNTTIGQYGNGFKTSTMRLGADVIVFSRSTRASKATQSIGLLSYTFLRKTGQDDVIVPMIDFDVSSHWAEPIIYGSEEDWSSNLKTILEWSPFKSKEDLLLQFEDIGPHGTKVIIFNLWLNDEGIYELAFDDDDEDIRLRDEAVRGTTKAHKKIAEIQNHISYRIRYSLRAYASMLYLRPFKNFQIILRGKPVQQFNIADELRYRNVITYKPQLAPGSKECAVVTSIGFIKEAPALAVSGFNVYHKNRLIRPFWKVTPDGSVKGNGVVGVLEADFIEPAHDKQDFERSSLFVRLENKLKQMVAEFWKNHCHLIGYKPLLPSARDTQKGPGQPPVVHAESDCQQDLGDEQPVHEVPDEVTSEDDLGSITAEQLCEENILLFQRCDEYMQKEAELRQTIEELERQLEEMRSKCTQLSSHIEAKRKLKHEGDFSFREAWFHLSDEYPIKYEAERLPPPLVADLNGDGKKEILVATHDAKIQVLEPHARRVDEGFSEARLLAEVSLLPDKTRVASGRRPVAMATGVIDRTYKTGQPQKQVLVVVTSGWWVLCFDHNLKKLWESNHQDDFPHNAHHREIAISISNYTLKHGDSGLVIVGGRMEMQPHIYLDPFEEIGMAERDAEQHRRSASEKEGSENSGTVNLRHFAFYAHDGRKGELRWSRKNENIEEHSSDPSQLIPQHNYKLDVHALNTRHPGEVECREYRESILGVMPHHWDRREDTLLKLSHFKRHKRKTVKKVPGKSTTYPFHKPEENHPPGKDETKKISNLIGKAAKYANSAKPKKPMAYIPTITNYTQLWWVPNVVVAHQKEGIEAVHLASGRTICKLHLQEGGLHADINGDGVLDHVQAVGGNGAEQTVVSGSMDVLRPCWAVATSGVPVREQLFNASICHHSPFNLFQHGDFYRGFGRSDTASLEVATPILIPKSDGHRHRKGSHGDVVFLTNRGEVTAYSPGLHGHDAVWRWQLLTEATWSNLPSPSGMMEGGGTTVPTLKPISLRVHDSQQMILAAGDQTGVIISPGGSILASIDLPAPPTHALITEDFSNDGLTDLIVVTSNGVYGFVQTRRPGALFFSTLVGCLLVVMGVIFITQHLNSVKGKPRGPR
ncbi:hypothetical protein CCACVL1_26096 [Corchorus capsularis]|uniref:Morc S5 domain-containing protein n=1 Tax=Corchorus capsularis TaxID=210143 RepID=A0A1R3GFW4_COCAP|nr:hypothetical protein CCACVL1_26096 [Corchorus capsularis]